MIRLVADSVAGAKCFIVYDECIPLFTIWWDYDLMSEARLQQLLKEGAAEEFFRLLETMRALNVPYSQMAETAGAFLMENLKEKGEVKVQWPT